MVRTLLFSLCIISGYVGFAQNNDTTGGVFIGRWHSLNSTDTLDIQKNGEKFTVQTQGAYSIFKLEDGMLKKDGSNPAKIIYNSMNGHIFWKGKELEYVETAITQAPGNSTADNIVATEPQPAGNVQETTASTPPPGYNSTDNGAAVPPYGLVKDNLAGPLAQQESVLFRYSGDVDHPNKLFYLDFNFHEPDYKNQLVVNAILSGIEGTNRFSRIPFDKYHDHENDSIFYIISYSNPFTNLVNTPSIDKYGNQLYNFTASIGVTVSVTDYNGKPVYTKPFNHGNSAGERFHLLRYGTEEDAVKHGAKKMADKISNYFIETFSVNTYVISIDEKNKDGSAKTIMINGGENMGLYAHPELNLKIMCDDKKIGEVRVKNVDDKTSICKVQDGGDVIAAKVAAGAKLQAISE